ncbi:MAG TPA: family 10 glycosylhydrolase [Leptospiraceae bacterium]|nr:family 10 glycosylhydrolase [Leptospirales bacterium]HMU82431.1 family 10 glycosylhydrolase [Leptospiraceae bacterium]HMX57060.1 family 10 glycosylhydrolase [Leptospiraceae bacterium]HNE24274.1 family 10 glycosylhydrolase [Leptospiraceae bacterium]HNJ33438.1 family 10 glycosylhydrolase [Leptospiraceae bacterium]
MSLKRFPLICASVIAIVATCSVESSPYDVALSSYSPVTPLREVRALWIVRDSIKTTESIRAIVESMRRNKFNTAIVQVRGRGDAYYRSEFVPVAAGIAPGLDPLAEFIRVAKPYGISVHAWINVFLGADRESLRTAPKNHLAFAHRDWFLRDRSGRSMLTYSAREMRAADVEGAFLDPSNQDVRRYNVQVVHELLSKYPVDGIHLDYIRYPSSQTGTPFDFGINSLLPTDPRKAPDILAMRKARAENVTQMVSEIREEIRRIGPSRILSAAVWPNKMKVEERVFQMWPEWLRSRLIDYAFLMAYYDTETLHDQRVSQFFDPEINNRMIIGVGIYKNPAPKVALHQLTSARAMGAAGICYFHAEWFLSKNAIEKEKKYQLPEVFDTWKDPGFTPARTSSIP